MCYGLVYILCTQVLSTNSRTSTLWKLNTEEGKIVSGTGGSNCKLQVPVLLLLGQGVRVSKLLLLSTEFRCRRK